MQETTIESLQKEAQRIVEILQEARTEIAAIANTQDSAGNNKGIFGLEDELNAVITETEAATNTIMDHAETVMRLSGQSQQENTTKALMEAAGAIMEACSFQDITGQRIQRVIAAIHEVQQRTERLVHRLEIDTSKAALPLSEDTRTDAALLAGPQNQGEGVSQDDIDALMQQDLHRAPN
jgi:chemotaxis protein CheZ